MTAVIIFALMVALSVASILWLLYRLNRFQRSEPLQARRSLFLRRWSYILKSENYTEPGRQLLPWLRLSLAALAVSVIAALVTLLVFVQRQV